MLPSLLLRTNISRFSKSLLACFKGNYNVTTVSKRRTCLQNLKKRRGSVYVQHPSSHKIDLCQRGKVTDSV